jgi:hypothetical protein
MNDNLPEVADTANTTGATDSRLIDPAVGQEEIDFDGLPAETDVQAGLAESEEDIKAGRTRPAREAILAIAARHGIRIEE